MGAAGDSHDISIYLVLPSLLSARTPPWPSCHASTSAAGRTDIAAGQRTLEAKLDTLLQRQQAALDAALTASATLAAIQGMAERQVAALSGLDAAVKEQVKTISVATQQGLISLATVGDPWGM
jgi:hypothetical protein